VTTVDVLDSLSWSPDGTRLVFSAPAGDAPALFLVTVADGSTTQLKTPAPAASPAWCPDRDVILYVEAKASTAERPSSSKLAAVTSDGHQWT
jgi:Tol biopolymer transport system component